jgi:hypothetical protein
MQTTNWRGPRGTRVTIQHAKGAKPPRWALLLVDRIMARDRSSGAHLWLRWVKSTRGGSGVCYADGIRVSYDPANEDRTRYVLIHELAHLTNPMWDMHGPGWLHELARHALDERASRLVMREHSHHRKAPLRRAFAEVRKERKA